MSRAALIIQPLKRPDSEVHVVAVEVAAVPVADPSDKQGKARQGKLEYLGLCSVDDCSRAAAEWAYTWVRANVEAITEVFGGQRPRLDLEAFALSNPNGSRKCGVDVVMRLAPGLRSVMQTAPVVLALVAMAWDLESKEDIAAGGDTAVNGRLVPFPELDYPFVQGLAAAGVSSVMVPSANAAQLDLHFESEPLEPETSEEEAAMAGVRWVGCGTMLDMIREVYVPAAVGN